MIIQGCESKITFGTEHKVGAHCTAQILLTENMHDDQSEKAKKATRGGKGKLRKTKQRQNERRSQGRNEMRRPPFALPPLLFPTTNNNKP